MGTACYTEAPGTCSPGSQENWALENENFEALNFSKYTEQWCMDMNGEPAAPAAPAGDMAGNC